MDFRSHETRAHLGNDLHKIFAKKYSKFQGGVCLELPSLPHFFPPSIASSLISLAMFNPTPEKPNPHLFET